MYSDRCSTCWHLKYYMFHGLDSMIPRVISLNSIYKYSKVTTAMMVNFGIITLHQGLKKLMWKIRHLFLCMSSTLKKVSKSHFISYIKAIYSHFCSSPKKAGLWNRSCVFVHLKPFLRNGLYDFFHYESVSDNGLGRMPAFSKYS